MKVIATVRLGRGEVAFYDEVSRIYLTLSRPIAQVYDNVNTANIKRAIYYRRLELISGTLDPVIDDKNVPEEKPSVEATEVQAVQKEAMQEKIEIVEHEVETMQEVKVETKKATKKKKATKSSKGDK